MASSPSATLTSCPDPAALGKLLREELSATEAVLVEEHVGSCPGCQRVLDLLVGTLPHSMGAAPPAPHAHAADDQPPELPGYEPVGRIDAGGMGVVWRVRDLQFGRPLALKVMKSWASLSPRLVERFVVEAQLCGQLAHPYIVPVHTMGRLPDGRPYYAMKLVEGRTLAALLAGAPAPAERRTEFVHVFGQVCQAVAFAHEQGIIHRDLKPENVMVGAHDEVQLMDWGLAKVLDAAAGPPRADGSTVIESTSSDAARTRVGSVLGTVAYMPPEQARGQVAEIDRRSDVFGLGAILCAVLTGKPPFAGPDPEAMRARAAEADLGEALARLRGCGADPELVRLAERCLAPRKADRPADAGEVAAAVAACLSGAEERLQQERLHREREQVRAAGERRRRRLWMGLAASVFALVCVLGAGLVVVNDLREQEQEAREQAEAAQEEERAAKERARKARDLARKREQEAQAAGDRAREARDLAQKRERETWAVMDDLSSAVIDDWLVRQPQLHPEQVAFLKKGLAYYEKFIRDTGGTPEGRAALARAYRRVGAIRRQIGPLPEAQEALEQAARLGEALVRESPKDAAYREDAAESLQMLATVLMQCGLHKKAEPILAEAVRHQREAVRHRPDDKGRGRLGRLHVSLGLLRMDLRQMPQAEAAYREAVAILDEEAKASPKVHTHRRDLAEALRGLGSYLDLQGKHAEAEALHRRAVVLMRGLAKEFPYFPVYGSGLSDACTSLGVSLYRLGRLEEAREAQAEALAIMRWIVQAAPGLQKNRQDLARALNNLALTLGDLGQVDESEALSVEAVKLREQLVKESPENLTYVVTLGHSYFNLGALYEFRGMPRSAHRWFDRAVKTLEPIAEREGPVGNVRGYLHNAHVGRAKALERLRRPAEAVKDWDRAIELDDGTQRLLYQGRRAMALGDHAAAVALFRKQARAEGVKGWTLYHCAAACARAAGAVKDDDALREQYADQAMALLRRAAAAGYTGGPRQNVRNDDAFDPLRGREDFQEILKQAAAKGSAGTTDRE